jgi:glycosyltransferase involved in cell wall biosynthesis
MNCYNGEPYLAEAVRSVLAQTHEDFEVILWDNQSEDRSADVFRSFADRRLKYFRAEERTRLGAARNLAAAQATGEWLAFLDVDDVWIPEKLERQVAAVARSSAIGFAYGYTEALIQDGAADPGVVKAAALQGSLHTGHARGALPSGDLFTALLRDNFIPLSSLCVRRATFESVGGFRQDLHFAEDYDLLLKVARVSHAACVQELCCWYRVHSASLLHRAAVPAIREGIAILAGYVDHPDHGALVARQLRHFRARLALHEARNGHRLALVRLMTPSLFPAAVRLLGTNLAVRARATLRG